MQTTFPVHGKRQNQMKTDGEVFGEDVNPDDLDIDETDEDGREMPEDDAELYLTMNGNVAYADGCTIDEMTETVKTADKPESEQSPKAVKTLFKLFLLLIPH
jgi:hypothetical protein